MKRVVIVAVLGLVGGCSNAPVAGFLDTCFLSKPAPPPSDRPRHPLLPEVGPRDRISPPAGLGAPVGPPGN